MRTHEGAFAYNDAINNLVEFFSKAGSLFEKGKNFYSGASSALDLFMPAWDDDKITSFKLLMWLRDPRGGAGNRSGFRSILKWIANQYPEWIYTNIHLIPVYGRWDDLTALFSTPLRQEAGKFWASALSSDEPNILAAKWAKRHHKPTRRALGMKEAEFRKLLASIRQHHIVEHKRCQQQWNTINYQTVPSVAMARYTREFDNRDHDRFQVYKAALTKGEAKVHADVLYPHDCIRTAWNGDADIAEAQFNALPNFLEGTDGKIMVICDTSGSMDKIVSGSVRAVHISQGMALYCSSRLPENSPFYKRFIGFGSEGRFVDWRKYTFKEAIRRREVFDRAVASTRIDMALDLILKIAVTKNIEQRLMPTTLLIVSDMQFSDGVYFHGFSENQAFTEVDKAMKRFAAAGYEAPKVVYWNTDGHKGQQATVNSENVGLVSGFSPAICKAIFGGDDFSPYGIMMRAIEKYEIIIPKKIIRKAE